MGLFDGWFGCGLRCWSYLAFNCLVCSCMGFRYLRCSCLGGSEGDHCEEQGERDVEVALLAKRAESACCNRHDHLREVPFAYRSGNGRGECLDVTLDGETSVYAHFSMFWTLYTSDEMLALLMQQ